jgi:hypothetical protein
MFTLALFVNIVKICFNTDFLAKRTHTDIRMGLF